MGRKAKLPRGIRPRPGGQLLVDVSVQGRRRTAVVGSLAEAKKVQTTMRAALLNGTAGSDQVTGWTLREAYERTRQVAWDGTRGERTAVANAKEALDYFGEGTPCYAITTDALDKYVRALFEKGNGNATINRKLAAVSKMLSVAHERGGLESKPKVPKRKEPVGRVRYLTEGEEAALLRQLEEACPPAQDAVIVLLDTGLRLGELLRLMPDDVQNGVITVWQTKADLPRSIPMTERVKAAIQRRPVFVDPVPLFNVSETWLRGEFTQACRDLGLEGVTLHTLRHTCASRLVQRGVPITVVQQWLGHKSVTMTMRYAHLSPKNLEEAAAALEPRVN